MSLQKSNIPLQESDYNVHEQIDLYDDVISPSANNGDAPEDRDYMDSLPPPVGGDGGKGAPSNVVYTYTGKRVALYIGNLTWVSVHLAFANRQVPTCPSLRGSHCLLSVLSFCSFLHSGQLMRT